MASRYSGAWARKASEPTPEVPLVPQVDPEHLDPTDNIDVAAGNPLWVSTVVAPILPLEYTGEPYGTPVSVGGGPIDMTPGQTSGAAPGAYGMPPTRSQFGVGVGPGLTTLESQQIRGDLMSIDMGAVEARAYQPITDRTDGSGPHSAVIFDTPGDGESPQTLLYERSGVGLSTDPYARTGKRIKRWWDRFIDMHRWGVELRPMYVQNAYTAPNQPAVPYGTQYDSPFSTPGPYIATPDSFVRPQDRTTPGMWDKPDTVGDQTVGVVSAFGLPSWGL